MIATNYTVKHIPCKCSTEYLVGLLTNDFLFQVVQKADTKQHSTCITIHML